LKNSEKCSRKVDVTITAKARAGKRLLSLRTQGIILLLSLPPLVGGLCSDLVPCLFFFPIYLICLFVIYIAGNWDGALITDEKIVIVSLGRVCSYAWDEINSFSVNKRGIVFFFDSKKVFLPFRFYPTLRENDILEIIIKKSQGDSFENVMQVAKEKISDPESQDVICLKFDILGVFFSKAVLCVFLLLSAFLLGEILFRSGLWRGEVWFSYFLFFLGIFMLCIVSTGALLCISEQSITVFSFTSETEYRWEKVVDLRIESNGLAFVYDNKKKFISFRSFPDLKNEDILNYIKERIAEIKE
jgi:hypothetical protein